MNNDNMITQTGLYRRGATYWVRCKIPSDVQAFYLNENGKPQREIHRSLRTKDKREAAKRLHIEWSRFDDEFQLGGLRHEFSLASEPATT